MSAFHTSVTKVTRNFYNQKITVIFRIFGKDISIPAISTLITFYSTPMFPSVLQHSWSVVRIRASGLLSLSTIITGSVSEQLN